MALLSHSRYVAHYLFCDDMRFFPQYIAACYTLAYESKRLAKVFAADTGLAERGAGRACSIHCGNRTSLQRTLPRRRRGAPRWSAARRTFGKIDLRPITTLRRHSLDITGH